MFQITAVYQSRLFLKTKYGNAHELIFQLIDKLESCALRLSSISGQKTLYYQIQVIVEKNWQEGEHLGSWMLNIKFHRPITAESTCKDTTTSTDTSPRMNTLLTFPQQIISTKKMMSIYMKGTVPLTKNSERTEGKPKFAQQHSTIRWMYCGKTHRPFDCEHTKHCRENQDTCGKRNCASF